MINAEKKSTWIMILVIAALCAIVAAAPLTAGAAERPHFPGHKQVDVDIYKVPASEQPDQNQDVKKKRRATSFPPSYDSSKMDWFAGIEPGNQGQSSLCWAFATAKLAQISYAKELSDNGIEDKTAPALSPVQLGFFFYNRLPDPLGLTVGDKNLADESWYDDGGNMIWTAQHLATWSGMTPACEDDSTENLTNSNLPKLKPAESKAYDENVLVEQNTMYYDDLSKDEKRINKIKALIMEYGAAQISIRYEDLYGGSYFAQAEEKDFYNYNYKKDETPSDHEVVVVGWNDNYPKGNFKSSDRQGNVLTPKYNGAWIVMNSYGTEWNDGGYMYISYESQDVYNEGIMAIDMQEADPYMDNYQYDGNANCDTVGMYSGEKAANIYTARKDHQISIKNIGFTAYNEGETKYRVNIYTGLTDLNNPESGIKAASVNVETKTAGYKSFELPDPVMVDAGENFSIVVIYQQTTRMGIESEAYTGPGKYEASLAPKQSLYYANARWYDAYWDDNNFCFRIKALAINNETCIHTYQKDHTVAPTKSAHGYTVYYCADCGHGIRADYTPMKSPTPNKIKLKKVTKGKKCMTVKWGKSSEIIRSKHVTGYQIRYSLKKNMKKAKKVTCKGWTKTAKKIKKLKSGKRYYVQVRAYFKYGGRTYYSVWSNKKTIKTR